MARKVHFATGAAGSLRVEIQEPSGTPLPGFALADCPEMIGDQIDRVVAWKGGRDLGALAQRAVRLRFAIKDGDLYALRFQPAPAR